MAKKLSEEEIEKRFSELYNGEYKLMSKYIASNKPIKIKHECGYIYEIKQAKMFLKENRGLCPKCREQHIHSTRKITEKELIDRIYKEYGDEYSYITGFIKMNDKILVKHNACGYEWEVTPHMFLGSKKSKCPICSNSNRGKYSLKENYLETLLEESPYGDEYEWLDKYKNNNKIKLRIRHKLCNHIYEIRPNDFQQGYLCPFCSSSKEQKEIFSFIKNNYNGKIEYNKRIDNKEIDIYLPDLNIGFEYNGSYWHSDKIKDKNYHLDKLNFFKSKEIDIYFIEEYQWLNKTNIVKRKILNLIHCEKAERIYARKTKVKFNLDISIKRKLLNRYHIQGYCHDSFNFYLTYNNKIVALMTFSFNRKNINSSKLELVRYVTHGKYHVIGGFSKLLKHSIEYIKNNYPNYNEIISYADKSWSRGNVYIKNGFTLDHESKPSYFYYNKNLGYINRFTYRKSNLKKLYPEYYNDNLTEKEITNNIPNLYRIWNCGNYVFKYNIKN